MSKWNDCETLDEILRAVTPLDSGSKLPMGARAHLGALIQGHELAAATAATGREAGARDLAKASGAHARAVIEAITGVPAPSKK